jgi:putative hydrolase of the HAD superfamily
VECDVEAILFDADGVVQSTPPGWQAQLGAQLEGVDVEEILIELAAAETAALDGATDFPETASAVLSRWRRDHCLDAVLSSWQQIEADQVVLDIIAELRAKGVRCFLATNQTFFRAKHMRKFLGYSQVFDGQFYSCELGAAKPDRLYFTTILDELALPPQRVLFLDDSAPNVEAAAGLGIRSALYPRGQSQSLASILAAHGVRLRQKG